LEGNGRELTGGVDMMKARWLRLSALVLLLEGAAGCSLQKMAVKSVAGMLSSPSGTSTFTRDNDPELVADALPFALKFYESILDAVPDHRGLILQTGSLYIMYANAFLQTPGDMMPREEDGRRQALLARAKNLYLRGRDMLLKALEKKNPLLERQWKERRFEEAVASFGKEDVPLMYWAAAGWVAAFALDPFDMKLGITLPRAASLMDRVLALEPGFSRGAVHNFYVLYYGSLPDYMGGSVDKARDHFRQAVEAAGNHDLSPFLSLASTVDIKEQNAAEFRSLLGRVLAANPDDDPDTRLVNILNQRKARWLLDHLDDFFLLDEKKTPSGFF
jgi:predicted anti-sigma-YlaC factor YlaD